MEKVWNPSHFIERIVPRLRDGGASDAQIERLLVDNPRRFFAGEAL
jgi:predicted metal-dependent phosphotriesterase family hydrolase